MGTIVFGIIIGTLIFIGHSKVVRDIRAHRARHEPPADGLMFGFWLLSVCAGLFLTAVSGLALWILALVLWPPSY